MLLLRNVLSKKEIRRTIR